MVERLQFVFGSWFLGVEEGVPYRSEIFTQTVTVGMASVIVSDTIRAVDGVTGVSGRAGRDRPGNAEDDVPVPGSKRGGNVRHGPTDEGCVVWHVSPQRASNRRTWRVTAVLIEAALQKALGSDLNLASETPQGQLTGVLSLVYAKLEELSLHVAAGLNLGSAIGRQVDDYGSTLTLPRIVGERSSVTATLSGVAGTLLPSGIRARTAAGAVFASDVDSLIPAAGQVHVLFRSLTNGPIVAGVGELVQLVDVIPGLASVTNAAAAGPGAQSRDGG